MRNIQNGSTNPLLRETPLRITKLHMNNSIQNVSTKPLLREVP